MKWESSKLIVICQYLVIRYYLSLLFIVLLFYCFIVSFVLSGESLSIVLVIRNNGILGDKMRMITIKLFVWSARSFPNLILISMKLSANCVNNDNESMIRPGSLRGTRNVGYCDSFWFYLFVLIKLLVELKEILIGLFEEMNSWFSQELQ